MTLAKRISELIKEERFFRLTIGSKEQGYYIYIYTGGPWEGLSSDYSIMPRSKMIGKHRHHFVYFKSSREAIGYIKKSLGDFRIFETKSLLRDKISFKVKK